MEDSIWEEKKECIVWEATRATLITTILLNYTEEDTPAYNHLQQIETRNRKELE